MGKLLGVKQTPIGDVRPCRIAKLTRKTCLRFGLIREIDNDRYSYNYAMGIYKPTNIIAGIWDNMR